MNGSVKWNVSACDVANKGQHHYFGWFAIKGNNSSVLVNTNCYGVMSATARLLSSPLLTVAFQEKTFWEASLSVDGDTVFNFSTSPTYWGEEEAKSYLWNANVLAEIWDVPVERIERYLVDWELTDVWIEEMKIMSPGYKKHGEQAYPADTCEYGDPFQCIDFINALGAADPQEGERFIVHLPPG